MPGRTLGIIPARAGSKRIPNKNFKPFAGTTLTNLAIEQALESTLLTDIVVSSDSPEVLTIAAKYETITAIDRPKLISNDLSPAIDYIRHTLQVYEAKHAVTFELVVIIQPSSPLRTGLDIDNTIRTLLDSPEAYSAVSVVKLDHMTHPLKLKTLHGTELRPYIEDEKGRFAAEDLPDVYVRNCGVYATWRKELETRDNIIGDLSLAYVMPAETSIDINEMIEFEFAEYLYNKQHRK